MNMPGFLLQLVVNGMGRVSAEISGAIQEHKKVGGGKALWPPDRVKILQHIKPSQRFTPCVAVHPAKILDSL